MFIISFLETGKKSLNDGEIPKLKFMERQHRDIVQEDIKLSKEKIPLYKSFTEFANRVRKLKLDTSGWHFEELPNKVTFKLLIKPYIVPQFEIIVDETLSYTRAAYGWLLPDNHELYKTYRRSVGNITISGLLSIYKIWDRYTRSKSPNCSNISKHSFNLFQIIYLDTFKKNF